VSIGNYGFWEFNGKNGLEGKASSYTELPDGRYVLIKDADFPAVLEDHDIAHCLQTSRIARRDFTRLFSDLHGDSQERLTTLVLQNPRATALIRNDQDFHDALQHENVTEDIRLRLSTRTSQTADHDRLRVGS
jgi:hypothetical protein